MKRNYIIASVLAVVILFGAWFISSYYNEKNNTAVFPPVQEQVMTPSPASQNPAVSTSIPTPATVSDTQAIEAEISNINKELQDVENSVSADLADAELGL